MSYFEGRILCFTVFVTSHASSASSPISRPKPDCFHPPNGVLAFRAPQQFTVTIPLSRAAVTRSARWISFVKMAAARPYTVSFAL